MTSKKLSNHAYAAASIIFDDADTYLRSYNTIVITVDAEGWLTCNGLYSRTTIKHIGWFMRELYGMSYYDAKSCYENDHQINVYTGEIRARA